MLDFSLTKRIWYWGLTIVIALCSLPSIFSIAGVPWPKALPSPTVALGLDLAGGSHLLLEASRDEIAQQRVENMQDEVRQRLANATPRIAAGEISRKDGRITFTVRDPSQVDAAREELQLLTTGAGLSGQRDWDIAVLNGNQFVLTPTTEGIDVAVDNAMESAIEVVRKRIDALGTREPTIIRQGTNRIVVQVPGLDDPTELKNLLGKTAKLDFKLVDQDASQADIAQGIAPPGSEIVPYRQIEGQQGPVAKIAVKRLGGISGDELANAQQTNDPQTNAPAVSITFNQSGGEKFAALTSANVGKPFAIILDGEVISAPNINEPILGGSAQISGGFTVPEAVQLAIALRSGALPVNLEVMEQRTVGPDLGADSIEKGMIALLVGTVALIVFIIVTYGRFGIYANIALIVNVLMILGIMGVMGVTLTLPGIAGFVLTIGAAVDANVLINERIREERRRGRRVTQAVENGYKEASRAIYDANFTNVIAAALMFQFGSGPIRGFAVVLVIGVITSVFTAVTLTRMWVAGWLRRTRPADLNL